MDLTRSLPLSLLATAGRQLWQLPWPHYPPADSGPAVELLGVEAAQGLCNSVETWEWRHRGDGRACTQALIPNPAEAEAEPH